MDNRWEEAFKRVMSESRTENTVILLLLEVLSIRVFQGKLSIRLMAIMT